MAILKIRPMRFIEKKKKKEVSLAINESLAITVGLSLVRAFAISAIEEKQKNNEISINEANCLKDKFENGIKFPDENFVNHGVYIENYANELYYAASEEKMCMLSLAHELFLLEVITRMS